MPPSIAALSLGFRHAYLDYERLTAQLRGWAEAFPAVCRLSSLATTPEGREVWRYTGDLDWTGAEAAKLLAEAGAVPAKG